MQKLQVSSVYGEFRTPTAFKGMRTTSIEGDCRFLAALRIGGHMKDLTKLTEVEANKLECALIMLDGDIRDIIRNYERIAEDDSLPDTARVTFKGNAEWWKEVYLMIYETSPEPSERNWRGEQHNA